MDTNLKEFLEKSSTAISTTDRKAIKIESEIKVLNLFHRAAIEIPAYKDFLKKNKINSEKIKSVADYQKVPFTTKENYIFKYELKDRCWNSQITNAHTIAASSGSTGEPVFWPRDVLQEIEGAQIHEVFLNDIFDIRNKKTLVVNSFGLGNWIAGMYTEFCFYLLRLKGLNFTLASPGYNQEETFKIIRNFSKLYDQTIIACHPPILKMMIENGIHEGINWKKLNIKFLGAAEGFSENWRDYILSLVGQRDVYRSFINIYGSADAGLMGFETPLSICIHRLTTTDRKLNEQLFENVRTPYLYQFDPRFKFLETNSQNEIMISCNATAPLIKYNIHDFGGILDYSKTESIKTANLGSWEYPFVYIYGRDKFMTTLYGVNIYPENIKAVLEHKDFQSKLTGRFSTEKGVDKNQDQFMILRVELNNGIKISKELEDKIKLYFIDTVRKLNSEYGIVEGKFKEKMHPKIALHKFQDPEYFQEGKIKKMA